jgi:hypothetical protein
VALDAHGKPPPGRYGAGADVSGGVGATPSCLCLYDADTGEKALEYSDDTLFPNEFAVLCVAVCNLFSSPDGFPARLVWEGHGPGATFGKAVLDTGFRNVYLRKSDDDLTKKVSATPGWSPIPKAQRKLLDQYRAALYNRSCLNRSAAALDETLQFHYDPTGNVKHSLVHDATNPAGAGENHGDLVVADALAWMLVLELGFATKKDGVPRRITQGSLAWRRELAEARRRESEDLYR